MCTTLGMLTPEQAGELRQAGLSAYNHNLDTSPEFYGQITTTRKYEVSSHDWRVSCKRSCDTSMGLQSSHCNTRKRSFAQSRALMTGNCKDVQAFSLRASDAQQEGVCNSCHPLAPQCHGCQSGGLPVAMLALTTI